MSVISSQASQLILPLKVPLKRDIKKAFVDWLDAPPSFEALENPNAHVGQKPVFFSRHCASDLTRLQSLRNCLCDSISKSISHKHALEERALLDLCEYHATILEFLAHSFPAEEDETLPTLELTWKASVGPQQETHHALVWERVGCLFNLASLETYLAATECSTTTKEGRKEAVQHSQRAASYLRTLREDVLATASVQFDTVDYCSQHLELWEMATKAQAQRCAYEMYSLSSNGNPKILAMLAIAAAPIYNDALKLSQEARLVSELPRPMQDVGTHCKAWSLYLQARAPWHQAEAMRAAKEWGLEIAYCKQALVEIQACQEFIKSAASSNLSREFQNNVETTYRYITDRLEHAEKDNLMYGEEVPSVGTLPPISPHAMAAKSDLPLPPDCLKSQVVLFKNIPKP